MENIDETEEYQRRKEMMIEKKTGDYQEKHSIYCTL